VWLTVEPTTTLSLPYTPRPKHNVRRLLVIPLMVFISTLNTTPLSKNVLTFVLKMLNTGIERIRFVQQAVITSIMITALFVRSNQPVQESDSLAVLNTTASLPVWDLST